ncbi:hypothetical protein [uncultured Hoeflea sp.]|uniref:hypothetical protein n=1 Tax=uncultured Hoeflea sp. TaxID=538666 RepID=UPI002616EF9F|nr:hypothetical protein [uncultured Hoeflea sp.]
MFLVHFEMLGIAPDMTSALRVLHSITEATVAAKLNDVVIRAEDKMADGVQFGPSG